MRALLFGFGSLGRALLAALQGAGDIEIVAIIDDAPALAGQAVAALLPGNASDLVIRADLPAADGPTVLFHASTSAPDRATREIIQAIEAGYSVISAAEWMFHPWLRFGEAAAHIDGAARAAGTVVLGCGINPGFVFETLPILLARTVAQVDRLEILRISNVCGVGPADFAHLGFGLTVERFAERVADGSIEGHMGFPESVAALAECAGIAIDTITDRLEPTLAAAPITLAHRTVAAGEVAGITQIATGALAGRDRIVMTLEMFLDPEAHGRSPREAIALEGSRSFQLALSPAAPPVPGAAAMMMHAARSLAATEPGLVSLLDLPLAGGRRLRSLRAGAAQRDRSGSRFTLAS